MRNSSAPYFRLGFNRACALAPLREAVGSHVLRQPEAQFGAFWSIFCTFLHFLHYGTELRGPGLWQVGPSFTSTRGLSRTSGNSVAPAAHAQTSWGVIGWKEPVSPPPGDRSRWRLVVERPRQPMDVSSGALCFVDFSLRSWVDQGRV